MALSYEVAGDYSPPVLSRLEGLGAPVIRRSRSTRDAAIATVVWLLLVTSCTAGVADPTTTSTLIDATVPVTTSTATSTTTTLSPPGADLVLFNGTVITVDPDFTITSAVAVTDGVIVAVGSNAEVLTLTGPATRTIDLGGRALLPGIVDPHLHELQLEALAGVTAIAQAEQRLIENGRTTVGSPTIKPDVLAGLTEYADSGVARLRHHVYLAYNDHCDEVLGHWYRDIDFDRDPRLRFAIAGIKLFMDGGTCDAPAVSFDWDTHRWQGHGDLFAEPEEVAEVIRTADELGAQVVIHSAGDRALDSALDGIAAALDEGANPNRHRIDHLMFVRPDQLPRLAPLAIPPVLFGTHQTCLDTDESSVVRYLDDVVLTWLEPRRQIIDSNPGIPPAWHSDAPWLSISLFDQLAGLTGIGQRLGTGGGCESDILLSHAVTTREAIAMMTMGSAYAMGLDSAIGSIEVGKDADLVVLTRDPLPLRAEEHLDNSVEATIIAGEVAWCGADFCEVGPPAAADHPTASAGLPDRGPDRAFDGDTAIGWMAGAEPPQWIEWDLGSQQHVLTLRLVVDQSPAGFTRHIVFGGTEPGPTTEVARIEGATSHGDVIVVAIDRTVRYLRIETVTSPSWVGWLEIETVTEP